MTVKKKKIAAKAPAYAVSGNDLVFTLDVKKEGLEPLLGAAYLMTDVAFSRLDGHRAKVLEVRLEPKAAAGAAALKALARRFTDELSTQRLRWAIARENVTVREFITEQAVLLANGRLEDGPAPAQEPPVDTLSDEQRCEIEKLIAEVEDEIKTMNEKKTAFDPKNIKASWEEKQEAGKTEKKA
jgi:hypothetical protein